MITSKSQRTTLQISNALTDANGTMYQFFLNLPFGEPRNASSPTQLNYKTNRGQTMASQSSTSYYQSEFKFNGKELDTETGLYYYGARYYDPSLSIWLSVDPLAEKYPAWSPYNFVMNNPINLIDPDGREPIKPLTGTIQQAIAFFKKNGFTNVQQIINFYNKPMDANGNKLSSGDYVRYVYTEDNGWIDLRHYFGAFQMGEAKMDALELAQCIAGYPSCYSYEDLPSNAMGGDSYDYIGVEDFSPFNDNPDKSKNGEDFFNGLELHFIHANATNPENAPNYENLPLRERPKAPNSRTKEIETGKYVPQNRSEKPYDLTKFPKPSEEYLKPKE